MAKMVLPLSFALMHCARRDIKSTVRVLHRDDRWRTGGALDEIIAEAHLDPAHLAEGIRRFTADREARFEAAGLPAEYAR